MLFVLAPLHALGVAWGAADWGWDAAPRGHLAGVCAGAVVMCLLGALRASGPSRAIAWAFAAHLAGAVAGLQRAELPSASPTWLWKLDDGLASGLEGRVLTPPRWTDDQLRFDLELLAVHRFSRWWPAQARVRVRLRRDDAPPGLGVGDRIRTLGWLDAPRGRRNPGGFDLRAALQPRGIAFMGRVRAGPFTVRLEEPGPPRAPPWLRWRRGVDALLIRHTAHDAQALLRALVVGRGDAIPPELRRALSRCGVAHLVAISGLHIAIVALGLRRLLRALLLRVELRLGRDVAPNAVAAVLAGPSAMLFALFAGAAPSALRAGVMVSFALVGSALNRPYAAAGALAVSAMGLLAHTPALLYRAGFQLSFVAVAALVCLPRPEHNAQKLRQLFAASAAAALVTTPLAAWHFGAMSWIAPLTNIAAIPAMGVWLPVCLVAAGLSVAGVAGAWPLQWAAWPLEGFAWWTRAAAESSWAGTEGLHLSALPAVTATLCAFLALRAAWRTRLLLVAATLGLTTSSLWWPASRSTQLQCIFLDVGQGDATLLRFPNGDDILVDGGGAPMPGRRAGDVGRRYVVPALRALGVRRLRAIVATHGDADHIRGLLGVIGTLPVGALWLGHDPRGSHRFAALVRAARRHGIPVRDPPAQLPARWRLGGAWLEWLYPPVDRAWLEAHDLEANDLSVVLRAGMGRHAVLLPGDLEAPGEEALLELYVPEQLRAMVLKTPHHGSRGSSTPAFIAAVEPVATVVSAGRRNRFGMPHPELVQRYIEYGADLWRTDRDGAVLAELGPHRTRLSAWGSSRRLRVDTPVATNSSSVGLPGARAFPRGPER